eukprot:SAG22_NODE_5832_length_946_cov_1.170012_1_plen_152_part_00
MRSPALRRLSPRFLNMRQLPWRPTALQASQRRLAFALVARAAPYMRDRDVIEAAGLAPVELEELPFPPTPKRMMLAVRGDDGDSILRLVLGGLSPDTVGPPLNDSPLYYAAAKGKETSAAMLLACGADPLKQVSSRALSSLVMFATGIVCV